MYSITGMEFNQLSSAKTLSCMQGVNQIDIVDLENKICVVSCPL